MGCKSFRFYAENLLGEMAVGKNDIQKWFVDTIWMVLATRNYHLSLDMMWKHVNDEMSG